MLKTVSSLFLIFALQSNDMAAQATTPVYPLAVLDMTARNEETPTGDFSGQLYSAQYMGDITGYSYVTTADLEQALASAPVVLFSSGFNAVSMKPDEVQMLVDWVKDGGTLVMPALRATTEKIRSIMSELLGIVAPLSADNSKKRKIINWNTEGDDAAEMVYMDEPEEKATSIGQIRSYTYQLPEEGGADILATFDDGKPAVLRNRLGKGAVYIAGVNWRDVILRNQLNKDQSASREYNNGFEPSADMWPLWLRAIIASRNEVSAWKFTVPAGYTQLLVPTHDCDSRTAYDAMHYQADYESSLNFHAHYFLTVHYFRDRDYHETSYLSAFYNDETIPAAIKLHEAGHTVGSHSICHFPDFNKCDNMDVVTREEYAQRATCVDGTSTGASTWAEVVLSKQIIEEDIKNRVRSFRSGHLCNNPDMPEAFEIGEYEFASTYTGGDLLSEFPFFARTRNDWEGRVTDVLQIPLHISDVYNKGADKPALNDDTWETHPCVDQWESAMRRLRGNYASAVLLIHPNREWKMELQRRLTDRLDLSEVGCYNFEDYGDFWKARLTTDCLMSYDPATKTVTIVSDPAMVKKHKMTFAIEAKEMPSAVVVTDADGDNALECTLRELAPGRYLAIPDGNTGLPVYDDDSMTNAFDDKPAALAMTGEGLVVAENGDLTVCGIDGVTVMKRRIADAPALVDMSGLKSGLYIASLSGRSPLKLLLR
ncbi:MAG: hypothetical protein K2M04_07380 [Muribaculaceae bacterium]|nr:hypothetical protein [Muribaculaceae bacterium]